MANEEQLDRLLASVNEGNGCKTWNEWREQNPDVEIDLEEAKPIYKKTIWKEPIY